MNNIQKKKKKTLICLIWQPFLKLTKQRIKMITFQKKDKQIQEDMSEIEWSLDCSGQGECQPNISPSDGEEKMDFFKSAVKQKKFKK